MKQQYTTKAESIVLSYILVIGIMTILSALLISASAGYLETKHQSVTETQAEITVEAIASEVQELDKLARKTDTSSANNGHITFDSQTDDFIGQYPYLVSFSEHPEPNTYQVTVEVQSTQVDVVETTNFTTYTIDNINTNNSMTGSSLQYKYSTRGTLQLSDTPFTLCSVNTTGSYVIKSNNMYDGCISATGTISGGSEAIIYGDIESIGSELELAENITVAGNLSSPTDIQIRDVSFIGGSVQSGSNINIHEDVRIGGSVSASQDISTDGNVTIAGPIISDNSIVLGQRNTVNTSITSNSSVTVNEHSIIQGGIETTTSSGNINLQQNTTIGGPIVSDTDVSVVAYSTLESNITGESITIYNTTQVNGTITGSMVTIHEDSVIQGDVVVPDASQLSCDTNVTISGQSCTDYMDANY